MNSPKVKILSSLLGSSLIASVITAIISLIAGRIIGPTEFGKYALIISASTFLLTFTTLGLNTAAIKYLTNSSEKLRIISTLLFSTLFSSLITAIICLAAVITGNRFFHIEPIFAILTLFYTMALTFRYNFEAITKAEGRYKYLSVITIIATGVQLLAFLILFIFGIRNYMLLIIPLLTSLAIFIFPILKQKYWKLNNFSAKHFWELFDYGKFAAGGQMAGFFISFANRFIINMQINTASVGIYSIYNSSATFLPGSCLVAAVNYLFPEASKIENKKYIYHKINSLIIWGLVPLILINTLAVFLVIKLLGHQYPADLKFSLLFSLDAVLSSAVQLFVWINNSIGVKGIKETTILSTTLSVFSVITSYALISRMQIIGPLVSSILTSGLFYIFFFYKYGRN
jgi:O-antigen/teichoic acid export membrane protein